MVILKRFLVAVSFTAILVGCAGPKITDKDVSLEAVRATAEKEKVVAKAKADEAEIKAIGSLDPTQQGMAYATKMMRDVVGFVLDKDNKKPMGFYDMKDSVARQQNAVLDKNLGRGFGLAKVGGAIYVAGDVIKHGQDKIGDTINASGENSAVEVNRISSKSKTDTNQVGDGNSTGAVDASTVGPDKSSTVTEVVAPEEPVVEGGEFVPTEPPAEFDDEPVDIPEIPEGE